MKSLAFESKGNEWSCVLGHKSNQRPEIKPDRNLRLRNLYKPKEIFTYLHRSSTHPNATLEGFIKGYIIRHKKNTSDLQKAKQLILQLRLISRGYSESEIVYIVLETKSINRHDPLVNSTKLKRPPLVFVTKYNPALK